MSWRNLRFCPTDRRSVGHLCACAYRRPLEPFPRAEPRLLAWVALGRLPSVPVQTEKARDGLLMQRCAQPEPSWWQSNAIIWTISTPSPVISLLYLRKRIKIYFRNDCVQRLMICFRTETLLIIKCAPQPWLQIFRLLVVPFATRLSGQFWQRVFNRKHVS